MAPMDGGPARSGSVYMTIALASFAGFGGILYGFDTGNLSGLIAMDEWICTFGTVSAGATAKTCGKLLTTGNKSLATSILSAGTFFGALSASPLADFIGRRFGIIFGCAIFSIGVGLQLSTTWGAFIAGRTIAGLGVGMVSVLCPMYMTETAPKAVRGFVVGLFQWAITIGLLLAAIVVNSTKSYGTNASWRTPIGIQFAWAAILAVGFTFMPETPRFLLLKGREAQARKSLGRLTSADPDSEAVSNEMALINAALMAEAEIGKGSYMDCFRNGPDRMLLRTLTGMGIQAMQQLSGVNFIFYYGTTFFESSGISNPFTITIATNVVNVGMTIPGILAVDRFGRRKLLIFGAIFMCFCELIVLVVGVTVGKTTGVAQQDINLTAQRVLIAFVCLYIATFAATWGPGAYIVCAEIFPLKLRAKGISLSVASNWLWNFGIGYATPYLVDPSTPEVKTAALGVKVFAIWTSTCAVCAVFAFFLVPELRGLSLEQVDILYQESSIIGSNKYRQQMLEANEDHLNHHNNTKMSTRGHHIEKAEEGTVDVGI